MTRRIAIAYNFNDRDWFGGRNYFGSLLRGVRAASDDGEFQFVLVTGERTETSLPKEFPELEVVRTPLMDRRSFGWCLRQLQLRTRDADTLLARLLRRHGVDVLTHSMHLGASPGIKTISWLYDFQFLHLPEYWKPRHIRWASQWYAAAVRHCDAVVVSSQSALSDLQQFVPDGRARRYVLRFVSNPVAFNELASGEELRARYGLPPAYFYLPNQFWTNKNHRLVLDALVHLRSESIHPTIVCTGKLHDGRQPDYVPKLLADVERLSLAEQFRMLGIVPFRDTQALMKHARAVINPSRFEGWSTTVEEAKTLHKDLLLSDIPVHREQAPARGRFFSPDDAVGLATLIKDTMATPTTASTTQAIEADYAARLEAFGSNYVRILREIELPRTREATTSGGACPAE